MYIELAETLNIRGRLIKPEELDEHIKTAKGELYRSLYIYDDSILEHIKKTKSIGGFKGTVYPDKILLDFDGDNAINFAREAIIELDNKGVLDGYQIYFSGRGFHVELDNELFNFEYSPSLPETIRKTLSALFPNADPVWDKTRIYRCVNTINKKSNLYKIPLSVSELQTLTYEEITKLAKKPRLS